MKLDVQRQAGLGEGHPKLSATNIATSDAFHRRQVRAFKTWTGQWLALLLPAANRPVGIDPALLPSDNSLSCGASTVCSIGSSARTRNASKCRSGWRMPGLAARADTQSGSQHRSGPDHRRVGRHCSPSPINGMEPAPAAAESECGMAQRAVDRTSGEWRRLHHVQWCPDSPVSLQRVSEWQSRSSTISRSILTSSPTSQRRPPTPPRCVAPRNLERPQGTRTPVLRRVVWPRTPRARHSGERSSSA